MPGKEAPEVDTVNYPGHATVKQDQVRARRLSHPLSGRLSAGECL
jgi:cystathionine beta-lyase/cystathionine gamma-synthase